jgi:hypothetical protein
VYYSPYRRCLRRPKSSEKEKIQLLSSHKNHHLVSKNIHKQQQQSPFINDTAKSIGNPPPPLPDITAQNLNDLLLLCNSNKISALLSTIPVTGNQDKVISLEAVEINSRNCAMPTPNLNTTPTEKPTRPKKRRKYC